MAHGDCSPSTPSLSPHPPPLNRLNWKRTVYVLVRFFVVVLFLSISLLLFSFFFFHLCLLNYFLSSLFLFF